MRKPVILFLFTLAAAALAACGPSRAEIEAEIFGTQTAEASLLSGTSTAVAASIFATQTAEAPSTQPPAGAAGCEQFAADEMDLVLVRVAEVGEESILYFHMPGGVPGLAVGETDPQAYVARVGEAESAYCGVYEGYEERLYCAITLPESYLGTLRDVSLLADGCQGPIFSRPKISIQAAGVAQESDGEGGGGDQGGGEGDDGQIFIDFPDGLLCGPEPSSAMSNETAYKAWCDCMGGTVGLGALGWGCDY